MTKLLEEDLEKVVFNENVTRDSIDKYNEGELFGLRINSYSSFYPNLNGDTGYIKSVITISKSGCFDRPEYMLFKKISNYIIQDMLTGKKMLLLSNKDDAYNYITEVIKDHPGLKGLGCYYYLVDKIINKEIPIITIDLSQNVVDITEDYKISPEKTFIDAIDTYKKIIAVEALPRQEDLFVIQSKIEEHMLNKIKDQYEGSINDAYDLALVDNVIYDMESNNKKM